MHHSIQPFEMMDLPLVGNLRFIVKMEHNVLGLFSTKVRFLLYCIPQHIEQAGPHQAGLGYQALLRCTHADRAAGEVQSSFPNVINPGF